MTIMGTGEWRFLLNDVIGIIARVLHFALSVL